MKVSYYDNLKQPKHKHPLKTNIHYCFLGDMLKLKLCLRDIFFLAKVGELGAILATEVNWIFSRRRPLFVWENELLLELMEDLEGFRGRQEEVRC